MTKAIAHELRAPEPTEHRRRAAAVLLSVAALAGLVVLGLNKRDLHEIGSALGGVRVGWLMVAIVLMVVRFLARGESWFTALRVALPGARPHRPTVTRVLLIGTAGSTVAPGRAGEAARAWLIARHAGGMRDSLSRAVGTLLSQTLLNLLALMIAAIAGGATPGSGTASLTAAIAVPLRSRDRPRARAPDPACQPPRARTRAGLSPAAHRAAAAGACRPDRLCPTAPRRPFGRLSAGRVGAAVRGVLRDIVRVRAAAQGGRCRGCRRSGRG